MNEMLKRGCGLMWIFWRRHSQSFLAELVQEKKTNRICWDSLQISLVGYELVCSILSLIGQQQLLSSLVGIETPTTLWPFSSSLPPFHHPNPNPPSTPPQPSPSPPSTTKETKKQQQAHPSPPFAYLLQRCPPRVPFPTKQKGRKDQGFLLVSLRAWASIDLETGSGGDAGLGLCGLGRWGGRGGMVE